MRAMVVGELSKGSVLCPGNRIGATEDLKVGLYFLVDMFSFPISLRVIGSGKGEFVVKEFS